MKLSHLTTLFLTGALLTTTHVHANQIYKIGNKYTQIRPMGVEGRDYDTLPIRNDGSLGASKADLAPLATATPTTVPVANPDAERADAAEKALKEQQAQILAERCEAMRKNLAAYNTGGRIYDTNANGERVYLNDQEISSKKQRTIDAIAKDCS